jgi:hypothetical protein
MFDLMLNLVLHRVHAVGHHISPSQVFIAASLRVLRQHGIYSICQSCA